MRTPPYFLSFIAHPEQVPALLRSGIPCDENGQIQLIEDVELINVETNERAFVVDIKRIAQCQMEDYAVIRIQKRGLQWPLVADHWLAENYVFAPGSEPFEWIARQPRIAPCYLKLRGIFPVDHERVFRYQTNKDFLKLYDESRHKYEIYERQQRQTLTSPEQSIA